MGADSSSRETRPSSYAPLKDVHHYSERDSSEESHHDHHHSTHSEEQEAGDEEEAQLLVESDVEEFELEELSPRRRRRHHHHHRTPSRNPLVRLFSFLSGPRSGRPRIQTITPCFPSLQSLPSRCIGRWFPSPRAKSILLSIYLCAWAVSFTVPLLRGKGLAYAPSGGVVRHVDCVDTLWTHGHDPGCGVDGSLCRPFANASFAFRCPASCAGVRVLNPYHVGPDDINYQSLVIGGPVYRGDSFLCGSAIHAGVISDGEGGCGRVDLVGEYYSYFGSLRNGISSITVDTYFPLSFTVTKEGGLCGGDPRWRLLTVSVLFTAGLGICTTSPAVLYWVVFVGVFVHVGLVSDPPNLSGPSDVILPELLSIMVGRLLPAMFVAGILYWTVVRRTLDCGDGGGETAAGVEKTVLWVGAFWVGALNNYTFDNIIPLARLTTHDLSTQPGAKLALSVIVLVLFCIICQQVYLFWLEGRLARYLGVYGLFVLGILACVSLTGVGLEVRLHHYVLALLLLPGTSIQTRSSLLYQGLLLGLFVNGIARWGFDPVLQTAAALRGDGGYYETELLPEVLAPLIYLQEPLSQISFKWGGLPEGAVGGIGIAGISVLVNDVERYRSYFSEKGLRLEEDMLTWTRNATALTTPEYFRFAYINKDGHTLDYTQAGTWFVNGSWSHGPGYYR
ncbi:hypothetical protein QBC46DRAFT_284836 [Diplogelasinospora grovesii]|uniref:LCCL domain-containing protein n=1 Tax=Diplogelasinospora grovesii TaxID=303347 RepID=A0AAN6S6W3_9PEZI|nr:hypothetical protein QBC46DRAFT_284836 [Diplogelasinospora grovesii]